ncbi:MAG TPA: hypothetical protein VMZ33_03365 [Candidatus Limnocylindrales bacterium]|nr:hypothetical protein [Candidatus Limnocylindrales bacterium]
MPNPRDGRSAGIVDEVPVKDALRAIEAAAREAASEARTQVH